MPGTIAPRISATVILPKLALQSVFNSLLKSGYDVIGPTIRNNGVVLESIEDISQLPQGYTLQYEAGSARLLKTSSTDYFGCLLSGHSWKRYLFPPKLDLLQAHKNGEGWTFTAVPDAPAPYAFIGVRACDLSAIWLQDDVFLNGVTREPHYAQRRERVFIMAVNCGAAAPTCFCTSFNTGPRARAGFDLAITELPESFVAEVGSEAGANMLSDVEWQAASAFDLGRVSQVLQRAEQQIKRRVELSGLAQIVYEKLDHPTFWDAVAARCLACGNCTLSCPTCFCSTVDDKSDLTGCSTVRTRIWDSCFTSEFSHMHGGNSRPTVRSRYRQWLMHKMAAWADQFGKPGCVGCGRCIVWCPVGIDITEETRALRAVGAR